MLFQPSIKNVHSRLPWFHSCIKPINKIIIIKKKITQILKILSLSNLKISGKIKTNSTSKTKKIKVTKKNRIENGNRALNFGENPHSKGLNFSWSIDNFLLKIMPNITTITLRIIEIITLP